MGEDCTDSAATSDEKACQWLPFEFHYKPGNVARAPAWVPPYRGTSLIRNRTLQ